MTEYVINEKTKRLVKKGTRTYKKMMKEKTNIKPVKETKDDDTIVITIKGLSPESLKSIVIERKDLP